MTADVDIANIALVEIGARPIADLQSDNTEEARACRARFAAARDAVQRAHPWNCCIARALVAADDTAPAFGWTYQYTLPQDPYCLRVLQIDDDRRAKWSVEGRKLLCDVAGPLKLKFIRRVEDVAVWDAMLAQAVGLFLAHSITQRLDDNRGKQDALLDKYVKFMREARSIDGQEGTPPDPDESDLVLVRY